MQLDSYLVKAYVLGVLGFLKVILNMTPLIVKLDGTSFSLPSKLIKISH